MGFDVSEPQRKQGGGRGLLDLLDIVLEAVESLAACLAPAGHLQGTWAPPGKKIKKEEEKAVDWTGIVEIGVATEVDEVPARPRNHKRRVNCFRFGQIDFHSNFMGEERWTKSWKDKDRVTDNAAFFVGRNNTFSSPHLL